MVDYQISGANFEGLEHFKPNWALQRALKKYFIVVCADQIVESYSYSVYCVACGGGWT